MVSPGGRILQVGATLIALALALGGCTKSPEEPPSTTLQPTTTQEIRPGTTEVARTEFLTFVEESWNALAIRDPEGLSAAGVSQAFGLRDDQLNDLSADFIATTQALEVATLDALGGFDPATLADDEKTTYGAYEWYLETRIQGHEFWLHDWPVHHFITSYNQGLIGLFTETHPLKNLNQTDDYVARILGVERQVDQLIVNLEAAEALGIFPPRYMIEDTISQLRGDMAGGRPSRTVLYTRLEEGLEEMGVNNATIADKTAAAEEAIEASFFPAWEKLIAHLESIEESSHTEIGLSRLPNGNDFYVYKLASHTSNSLSPQEIHDLGLREVERVQASLRALFDELGYPDDKSLGELRDLASAEAGFLSGDDIVTEYERLITEAESLFDPYFPTAPSSEVVVIPFPGQGAFYIAPTVDGSRPGSFHTGTGGGQVRRLTMPTIAYHETVPGHHFQIALAQETDLPAVQRFVTPTGYVEGWGLYGERLASDIGVYDDDPYGDVGRLELELLRAARLVVDTGIHYLGWARDEAIAEMAGIMGNDRYAHEIDRYVLYPGQATGYMVGMLTLLDLRDQMSVAMGDNFELAEFHSVAIGSGNLPLEVLRDTVERHLAD